MSDNQEKASYYMRLVCMYIDLSTETVLSVFKHHTPSEDLVAFMTSNHVKEKVGELMRKKVLNKEQHDKVTAANLNPHLFDISLLITLIINLFTEEQLPPPVKGWGNPPKNNDKSISADLLRRRRIRNFIVGHHPKAQLEKNRFEEEWGNVKEILLRLQGQIATEAEIQLFRDRIEEYRHRNLDPNVGSKYEQKLNEWHDEVSKIQIQVEDLLQKLKGFDVYFKNKPDRYERYIYLLDNGGRFVLSAFLNEKAKQLKLNLKRILREKEDILRKKIEDEEQIKLLYPLDSASSDSELEISSWDTGLLATLILNTVDNIDEDVRQEIEVIQTARETYAEMGLDLAFDDDTFADCSSDLKTSIKFISKYLTAEDKSRIKQIIEECKKKTSPNGSFRFCSDELRSRGIKSFSDLYKDTFQTTKDFLMRMKTENIGFCEEHVLELKIITCGTTEEKTRTAENILVTVWQEALESSGNTTDFQTILKEVQKILNEIKRNKDIRKMGITQKCIILSVASTSPSEMLTLKEYFESPLFHETVASISRELGYDLDTVIGMCTSLTIDSLHKIHIRSAHLKHEDTSMIQVPISMSAPAGISQLKSLLDSEKLSKSKGSIAETLSEHLDDRITFDIALDMKDFTGLFADGDQDSGSSNDDSGEELCVKDNRKFTERTTLAHSDEDTFQLTEKTKLIQTDEDGIDSEKAKTYTTTETQLTKRTESDIKTKKVDGKREEGQFSETVIRTRRVRKQLAGPAEDDDEIVYDKFALHGILLDAAGTNTRRTNGKEKEEERNLALSLLRVIFNFVEFDVSRYNRIFSVFCGASQNDGLFDIIGTIKNIQTTDNGNLVNASDETVESIFQFLEGNGARTIRKWTDKRIVRHAAFEYEAQVILHNLRSNRMFARRFVHEFLHPACRDWGGFSFLLQGFYVSILSLFRQATKQDVRHIVNQSMSDLNESLLMKLNEQSVYSIHDAASIVFGKISNDTGQSPQEILDKLEPFLYGKKPLYSALRETTEVFLESVSTYPNHQRILYVISDGCSTDEGNISDIKLRLKDANVRVVCLYVSKSSYNTAGNRLEDGAKILFDLSSTIPSEALSGLIFSKIGWQVEIGKSNNKLFLYVDKPEDLKDVCGSVRNALCCRDSLLKIIPTVSLDVYINQRNTTLKNHEDIGGFCYANAYAVVIHLAMHRILGRDDGYPDFKKILAELSNHSEMDDISTLQSICKSYRLHCRLVDSSGAMDAIAAKRPVIAKVRLTNTEWNTFGRFYKMNPFGILKTTDIRLGERREYTNLSGHAVVLTSYNSDCLCLMNCWGDNWADVGFFRVENADVLRLEFIDIFWKDKDLSTREKDFYCQHAPAMKSKLLRTLGSLQKEHFTCPLCKTASMVTEFVGTLSRVFCPKCGQKFSTSGEDERILALNVYITVLSRKSIRGDDFI